MAERNAEGRGGVGREEKGLGEDGRGRGKGRARGWEEGKLRFLQQWAA